MKKLFVAAALATALTSCSLTLPAAATSNPVGKKVGTATATGYLGVLFFGADASIQKQLKMVVSLKFQQLISNKQAFLVS